MNVCYEHGQMWIFDYIDFIFVGTHALAIALPSETYVNLTQEQRFNSINLLYHGNHYVMDFDNLHGHCNRQIVKSRNRQYVNVKTYFQVIL